MLLTHCLSSKEIKTELLWISENQKEFSEDRLKTLLKTLNSSSNEINLIRGEGSLKNRPSPFPSFWHMRQKHYI